MSCPLQNPLATASAMWASFTVSFACLSTNSSRSAWASVHSFTVRPTTDTPAKAIVVVESYNSYSVPFSSGGVVGAGAESLWTIVTRSNSLQTIQTHTCQLYTDWPEPCPRTHWVGAYSRDPRPSPSTLFCANMVTTSLPQEATYAMDIEKSLHRSRHLRGAYRATVQPTLARPSNSK